jgi:hypothetical protein
MWSEVSKVFWLSFPSFSLFFSLYNILVEQPSEQQHYLVGPRIVPLITITLRFAVMAVLLLVSAGKP